MDVIWTAEYAAQGWLLDVSDFISKNGDKFIPSTVDTTEYEGKNWAVPFNSNAGFIYYRTDRGRRRRPKTGRTSTRRPGRTTASSTRASATRA